MMRGTIDLDQADDLYLRCRPNLEAVSVGGVFHFRRRQWPLGDLQLATAKVSFHEESRPKPCKCRKIARGVCGGVCCGSARPTAESIQNSLASGRAAASSRRTASAFTHSNKKAAETGGLWCCSVASLIRPPASAAGRARRNRGSRRPGGRRSRAPGAGFRRCARRAAANASHRSVSPTA
ncbi:hypothetical protein ACVWVY_007101 [Bradyrhizobium sp. URHC0002]